MSKKIKTKIIGLVIGIFLGVLAFEIIHNLVDHQIELPEAVPFEDGKPVYLVAYYNTGDGATHVYDPQTIMEEPKLLKSNEKTWIIYAVFSTNP